jgi:hypothetical protein
MKTDVILKLEHPVQSGDWHDKPLKWKVVGPGTEVQMFATKREATEYRRLRRSVATQQQAISAFVLV